MNHTTDRIGNNGFRVPHADRIFAWIERMYALGPRRIGTGAGLACEDFLAGELEKAGLQNVRKDPIPIRVWEADAYALGVRPPGAPGFQDVPAHYIPYTAFTPDRGVEGELLYVKFRDPAARLISWKGRIVVADIEFPGLDMNQIKRFALAAHDPQGALTQAGKATWVRFHWSLYREAVRRGAAGFIGILKDHYAGGQNYYAPYGFREKDIHDKPVPGFWVDRAAGAKIRGLARRGGARARLRLSGSLIPGVAHNVMAELPGASDETFIIACHHDAPFASAVEDASGCAAVLAAAQHFAATRELRRSLLVLFTAGHFYGSVGTRTFIHRNPGRVLDRTALEFHVEHIARRAVENPDGRLEIPGGPEFLGAFVPFNRDIKRALVRALVAEDLAGTLVLPAHGPFGTYPPTDGGDFHLAGVPLVNFISPPLYLLNAEDTLDKVEKARLEPTARAVVRVLRDLDRVPLRRLRRVDYPVRAALMHALSRAVMLKAIARGI